MSEKDTMNLLAMIEAIEKIEKFTATIQSSAEFENDFKSFDACLMNFIVIGEMTLRLSSDFMEKHNEVEWYKMKAFRNMVAHDYFGIDAVKVWDIIKIQLPSLKIKINRITEK